MTTFTHFIFANLDFNGKSAAAKRMHYYAKAIADQNNAVYLITSCSNKFDQNDFVEVLPNFFILNNFKPAYSLFLSLRFLRHLYRFSLDKDGEKVFMIYPLTWFNLELITPFYLIFLKKCSVFYEFNEVKKYSPAFHEPQSFKKIKYAIKTLVHKSRFIVMDYLMRFYKGLVCISKDIEDYGKGYNKNTLRVPILTDPEITIAPSKVSYSKNKVFNIGFSGSILPSKENLFEFISVVEKAKINGYDVGLNLCGSVTEKNLKLITENREDLITYHGNLNETELSNFLIQQEVLVLPRGFTLQNKYGFSTKLSDYLNHKKVILITDISDNGLYIKDGFNGFVVEPNNAEMMYDRLTYIIDNFETVKESIIENAFNTSKDKFDYRLYKGALQAFLK